MSPAEPQETRPDGASPNTPALADPPVRMVDGELRINPHNRAFWDNPSLLARYQHQSGFWSTDDPSHVIFHETGHEAHPGAFYRLIASTPGGKMYPEVITEAFVRRVIDKRFSLMRLTDVSPDLARKMLSQVGRHAFHSVTEFVAEVFTGLISGKVYDPEIMAFYKGYGGPSV